MNRKLLLIVTLLVAIAVVLKIDSHHRIAHGQSANGAILPLYRLHNFSNEQRFYTTDAAERDNFISQGWVYDKIIGYVYATPSAPFTTPLYRINPLDPKVVGDEYSLIIGLSPILIYPIDPSYPVQPVGPARPAPQDVQIGPPDDTPLYRNQVLLGYVSTINQPGSQPLQEAIDTTEAADFWSGGGSDFNDLTSGSNIWKPSGNLCYLPSSTTLGNPGWPKQFGAVGDENGGPILIDHSGSVYIIGNTEGSLFGTNIGKSGCFVARYDASGNLLWGKQFGASVTDLPGSACVDSSNNLYVVGDTDGNLFGTNAGGTDAFVTKYSPDGTTLWSKQFGTSTQDFASDVAVDAQDNVYVVGSTVGGLFGPISGAERMQGAGADAYIVEYDASGNQLWTKQFGDGGTCSADRIRFDNAGNFYIAGGTASLFGPNVTGYDSYVAKYSPNKTLFWGRQFGSVNGGDRTDPFGLCIDATGNVYVAGATNQHDDIDNNPDVGDGYITKFDTNGNSLWTQRWATPTDDSVSGAGLDSQGNVYAIGQTGGSLFGPFTGSDTNGVIAKYDTNGNLISSIQYGGYTGLASIAIDAQDRLYLAGETTVSLFGPCAGGEDIFIQRLNSSGQMAKELKAILPTSKSLVDALGIRLAKVRQPHKNVLLCSWAGKAVALSYPPVLVGNHPYMYIGYTGIATKNSRTIVGKDEYKQVAVVSRGRQVVVNYGSTSYRLNGRASKMPVKPVAIGKECYVPLEVIQAAVSVPVHYDSKTREIAFNPPALAMRKRVSHKA